MTQIRFQSPEIDKTVTWNTGTGAPPTLLSLARANAVPILFTCGGGGCGACLVEVEVLSALGRQPPLTFEETWLLRAMDKLGEEGGVTGAGDDGSQRQRHRLACLYPVGDDDLLVTFTSGFGTI